MGQYRLGYHGLLFPTATARLAPETRRTSGQHRKAGGDHVQQLSKAFPLATTYQFAVQTQLRQEMPPAPESNADVGVRQSILEDHRRRSIAL